MSLIQRILLILITASAIGLQLWNFDAPFVLNYETGFQEQIARRHMDPGFTHTYGISTINTITESPTFHPTHPPGLQWILAALFHLLGDEESSARLVPFISYLLCLIGLWKITQSHLSTSSRIGVISAFAFAPLSFYLGRVVNFEPPVVACILWTVKWLQDIEEKNQKRYFLLSLLIITGTLIDWVYLLFLTCVCLLFWLKHSSKPELKIRLTQLWCVSFGMLLVYAFLMFGIGAFENVFHHVKVQSGMYQASDWKPPLFLTGNWWWSIGYRLFWNSTPVLFLSMFAWIGWAVYQWNWREGLPFWITTLFVFSIAYIIIFSRASNQHFWCLFYFMPFFVLMLGSVLEWMPKHFRFIPVIALLGFSFPINYDLRTMAPNQTETQFGRTISSGVNRVYGENMNRLKAPILYTNRVDPLAYYADLDTAYFYMSIGAAVPDNFLIRFRPEFVALSGLGSKTAVVMRDEDRSALYERLQKSYTLVHEEFSTQLWESNWSPMVNLMGLMKLPDGSKAETQFIDDREQIHIAAHIMPGTPAMNINLEDVWISGRRWLTGWAFAPPGNSVKPIEVTLQSERGVPLGSFEVQPQEPPFRWQPFAAYIGYRPHQLLASWKGNKIIFGDLRLVSETNYTNNLTRLLAGEIHRKTRPNHYQETITIPTNEGNRFAVSQRPGMNIDSLQVPHIRAGYHQQLNVGYGIHPDYGENNSPITFRLLMRDMALGKPYILFEDQVTAAKRGEKFTQKIDLRDHSRHVLSFTFEVESKQSIDTSTDSALWYEAQLISLDHK